MLGAIIGAITGIPALFDAGKAIFNEISGKPSTAASPSELSYEVQALPADQQKAWADAMNAKIELYKAESARIQNEQQANAAKLAAALAPFSGEGGVVRLPRFACSSCPGRCGAAGCEHAQYKFYAYVRPENLSAGWSRDRIIAEINAAGVPCYQGSCSEVYLEKAFDDTGWRPASRLPVAKDLGETSLMWLVHPTLTDQEIQKTCDVITRVFSVAGLGLT